MLTRENGAVLMIVVALALATAVPAAAQTSFSPEFEYDGAGTIVTGLDDSGEASTVADNGGVVCEDVDGDNDPDRGYGGTCIPFSAITHTEEEPEPAKGIHVTDDEVADEDIAFQVCVDMTGSGTCGSEPVSDFCQDIILYSHDTVTGENFNPLFVEAETLEFVWKECQSLEEIDGGFPGFIVITCAGLHAHSDDQQPEAVLQTHGHGVTNGTAQVVETDNDPDNRGDYCGAPPPGGIGEEQAEQVREKPYEIV